MRVIKIDLRVMVGLVFVASFFSRASLAQLLPEPISYGPYNGIFRQGGNGLSKPVEPTDKVLQAASPWSLYCWFQSAEPGPLSTLLAGAGNPLDEYSRYLGVRDGKLIFWMGEENSLVASAPLSSAEWHFVAATFDGVETHLYGDGQEVGGGTLTLGRVAPVIQLAPEDLPWAGAKHFGGRIADLTLLRTTLSGAEIQQLYTRTPEASLIAFEEGSKSWPVQTREQAGYRAPQDAVSLPRSTAPFSTPSTSAPPPARTSLQPRGDNQWAIAGGWKLSPAPKVNAEGTAIAQAGFDAKDWWPATVPGTVLTTMVDRGIYPDPDYGLNNLAIPELLNQQDYWYRTEFAAPKVDGRNLTLTFNGINYAAVVWLNGKRLGEIKGAFVRGTFDVTEVVKPGRMNALAVRISPPPHPGIPHEQSIKAGPGENGGLMVLDGPTFMATEGWDWIPAIRDRNTGIWQDVVLTASGTVRYRRPSGNHNAAAARHQPRRCRDRCSAQQSLSITGERKRHCVFRRDRRE